MDNDQQEDFGPKFRQCHSIEDGNFKVPIFDVRRSKEEREYVNAVSKMINGNTSKFIPGKWGYGESGPKKY